MNYLNSYWRNPKNARRWLKKKRKQKLADGLCAFCPNKREQLDKKLCDKCLKKRALAQKKIRAEKRELNICLRCSNDAVPGFACCQDHLVKNREYHRRKNGNSRSDELS